MTNKTNPEPVALMHPTCKSRILPISAPNANVGTSDWIPLYTTPQTKPLSDDVIEEYSYAFELWQLNNPDKALEGIKDFARAIEERHGIK